MAKVHRKLVPPNYLVGLMAGDSSAHFWRVTMHGDICATFAKIGVDDHAAGFSCLSQGGSGENRFAIKSMNARTFAAG